jgi:drug/metabolite transporter superfamily protein YnfA
VILIIYTVLLFFLAGLAEIGGGYLVWGYGCGRENRFGTESSAALS